ncbi:SlyX family protein [Szabonella alba]|uniref:SlyX family protein n=1 Tax=Szabonella alba TaxID=2804194 RepID=A0A8K0V8G5_9RHOB|nr:SlyX family protein [Szabonella alba]MBL4916221.1 SlyX family protein [Szabonella alba]
MADRIEAAEEQIAHLIRLTEDLSGIVAKQADRIDLLERRVAMLLNRVAEPDEGGVFLADQRPPHW